MDTALAKDVYLSGTELGLAGSDGQEGLDGLVCVAAVESQRSVGEKGQLETGWRGWVGRECIGSLALHLIWEFIPYLAWSSGRNSSGLMHADKSFCMPVCLPRRKAAILR